MIQLLMLIIAGVLTVMWAFVVVDDIEKYNEDPDYSTSSPYKFWFIVCVVWTPIAIFFGPILIQALIMIPPTVRWSLVFYYEELR